MVDPVSATAPDGQPCGLATWAEPNGFIPQVDITQVPDSALPSCRLMREGAALFGAIALFVGLLAVILLLDVQPAQLGIAGFATVWLADTALKLLVLPRQVGGAV